MLGIVAESGLDRLSVREVADAAGCSIGTVQHYFATKDLMLQAAFEAMVEQIRARLAGVRFGADPRRNVELVLTELLPLDDARRAEARVQLAFVARAAHLPSLAALQDRLLTELRDGLAGSFHAAGQPREAAEMSAHVALAVVDGLAQHAVSAPGWIEPRMLRSALQRAVAALLDE